MRNISCEFLATKSPCLKSKNARGGHLVFQNEAKNIPRQDFMVMTISCKFEKASYNIFFVRAVTVKSLYTLRRRRNEVKSIVSTGCYPVDTINAWYQAHCLQFITQVFFNFKRTPGSI